MIISFVIFEYHEYEVRLREKIAIIYVLLYGLVACIAAINYTSKQFAMFHFSALAELFQVNILPVKKVSSN